MEKEAKKVRPFGVRDQVGYVCGDMAGSFVNLFVDSYFLTFCTYVLGISAAWMASLFLVARLWDAINDPLMGSFPDRWHLGKTADKFKPWVKLFMVPPALSGVLCFTNVPLTGIALHAWVAFVYIFYGMMYTGAAIALTAIGYVSGTNVAQSAATISNIYYLVNIIPVLACILELVGIGLIFNLDNNKTNTMYAELKERRDATKSAE